MASWIEKKEIGDARVQEDGSASHRLHFRSGAGQGIAESVTQGYVFGATMVVNGITLTLTGKTTSQDGVYEDVFLEYTLPGWKPNKKLPPAGTIEIRAHREAQDVDVGEARNLGNAAAVSAGNAAAARQEQTVALPVLALTVRDTKAFTWSEANIISNIGAATPSAYLTVTNAARWRKGAIDIEEFNGRAQFTLVWYYDLWKV